MSGFNIRVDTQQVELQNVLLLLSRSVFKLWAIIYNLGALIFTIIKYYSIIFNNNWNRPSPLRQLWWVLSQYKKRRNFEGRTKCRAHMCCTHCLELIRQYIKLWEGPVSLWLASLQGWPIDVYAVTQGYVWKPSLKHANVPQLLNINTVSSLCKILISFATFLERIMQVDSYHPASQRLGTATHAWRECIVHVSMHSLCHFISVPGAQKSSGKISFVRIYQTWGQISLNSHSANKYSKVSPAFGKNLNLMNQTWLCLT